ncbi:DUF4245 family protein [Actinoplanes sp. NPDC051851]|uniref:DUF4245 domain-containing protein n=1 Tax=Actinoplanes sp. NPDC051851 TaxID=3154753 RepID=UPI00343785AF
MEPATENAPASSPVPPSAEPSAEPQASLSAVPQAASPAVPQVSPSAVPQASPRLAKREERRPRDMALSLAVLMVPIVLMLAFYRVVLGGDEPMTVDPASSIDLASKEFSVLKPAGLGEDWRVTAANFKREDTGATLRIGYVDPDDAPVQLVESTTPAGTLVPAEMGADGERTGAYRTDARTWTIYTGRPGETALISTEGARTVLILGKTDQSYLETLASSLS